MDKEFFNDLASKLLLAPDTSDKSSMFTVSIGTAKFKLNTNGDRSARAARLRKMRVPNPSRKLAALNEKAALRRSTPSQIEAGAVQFILDDELDNALNLYAARELQPVLISRGDSYALLTQLKSVDGTFVVAKELNFNGKFNGWGTYHIDTGKGMLSGKRTRSEAEEQHHAAVKRIGSEKVALMIDGEKENKGFQDREWRKIHPWNNVPDEELFA